MGITKTFCYCVSPARRCKEELSAKVPIAQDTHWQEIVRNCQNYLAEELCVPDAAETNISSGVAAAVASYLAALHDSRAEPVPTSAWYLTVSVACSEACLGLNTVIHTALTGDSTSDQRSSLEPVRPTGRLDAEGESLMEIGTILARVFARAVIELESAVEQGLEDYVAHHFALLMDIAHEMQALTLAAIGEVREGQGESQAEERVTAMS